MTTIQKHPDWQAGGMYASPLYHVMAAMLDSGTIYGTLYCSAIGSLMWSPEHWPEPQKGMLAKPERFVFIGGPAWAADERTSALCNRLLDAIGADNAPTQKSTGVNLTNLMQRTALHHMPDPPGPSLTELMTKGPEPMTTPTASIAAPEKIDATRAGAVAIENAYSVRQTQARLMELARLVGPATEASSLLRIEIRTLESDLATIESRTMAIVTEAKGEDGKKLYTNKESRDAACAKTCGEDANYQAIMTALNEKRTALAKAEAESSAINTEIGALKAVAQLASAALNALGVSAA